MTKKEMAEMEALKTRLALRFYPEVEPDIEIPGFGEGIKNGWLPNVYSRRVEKACTSSVYHNFGGWDKTTTQCPRRLYSTEKKAYEALLCGMAKDYAVNLRLVERLAEDARTD